MASTLAKSLSRLNRTQLIDLALHWLEHPSTCAPYLLSNRTISESDEEDYLFPPAQSVRELRSIYKNLRLEETTHTKTYIVDRIISGDWRRGLSLYQHATVDFAYLSTHDTALRWTALRLVPLERDSSLPNDSAQPPSKKRKISPHTQPLYPTVSPTTFAQTLRAQISPLVKAHYQLTTLPSPYDLPLLRLHLTPNNAFTPHQSNIPRSAHNATDGGRTIYIALPPSSPHIYIAASGPTAVATAASQSQAQAKLDITNLKRLIIEAIPKALSRRHERWALESTKLTVRSLKSICALRGGGERPGTAGGALSAFFVGEAPCNGDEERDAQDEGSRKKKKKTAQYGPEPSPLDVLGRTTSHPSTDPDTQDPAEEESSEAENPLFFPETTTTTITSTLSTETAHIRLLTARFGPPSNPSRAKLDRLTAKISDVLCPPSSSSHDDSDNIDSLSGRTRASAEAAPLMISFGGADVVLGLRMLAELSLRRKQGGGEKEETVGLDLGRMPGWMAGGEGRSFVSTLR